MASIAARQHGATGERTILQTAILGILLSMVVIWIPFQVIEIGSLFPPIGILYAVGSIIVATAIVRMRQPWSPAIASAWSLMMMAPEIGPAIGHLTDWSDLQGHFGHYLIIMTFFPLAIALFAFGVVATSRRYRGLERHAPAWLGKALALTIAFIVIADLVTIAIRVFDIV